MPVPPWPGSAGAKSVQMPALPPLPPAQPATSAVGRPSRSPSDGEGGGGDDACPGGSSPLPTPKHLRFRPLRRMLSCCECRSVEGDWCDSMRDRASARTRAQIALGWRTMRGSNQWPARLRRSMPEHACIRTLASLHGMSEAGARLAPVSVPVVGGPPHDGSFHAPRLIVPESCSTDGITDRGSSANGSCRAQSAMHGSHRRNKLGAFYMFESMVDRRRHR